LLFVSLIDLNASIRDSCQLIPVDKGIKKCSMTDIAKPKV